jgi:hypothetical protein
MRRLGFAGKYVIFDLPEFSALQRFYLGGLGLDASTELLTSVDELMKVCPMPELFVATWSLSETPAGIREPFREIVIHAKFLLMAYQDEFGGADNGTWFEDLADARKGSSLVQGIQHLPGNSYPVGWQ